MNTNQFKEDNEKKPIKKKETNMLLACFMLFVFPIISVIIGVFLGQNIGKYFGAPIKISQILGGIIAFVLVIVVIKLFDKSAILNSKEEKIFGKTCSY